MTMKYLNKKWQARFVRLANEVATWSKDPDCKVGAVLVSPDGCSFSAGFNGFPKGLVDNDERLKNKKMKNLLTVHAEVNALLNSHQDVRGWDMYVTKAPCHRCAAQIIQAGVANVFCPQISKGSNWSHSCLLAASLLKESGVNQIYIKPY